ncbi:MAG: antitoxin ParD1/3/4 [Candidatus Azotimanducaceae bacterium]|jgi:antitoxin ParD1/3/4
MYWYIIQESMGTIMSRNTSVTLGEHFEQFVNDSISAGRYQTVSEVIRAGLRKLENDEHKLEVLRGKLAAGERSSKVKSFSSDKFLEKMHKKHVK